MANPEKLFESAERWLSFIRLQVISNVRLSLFENVQAHKSPPVILVGTKADLPANHNSWEKKCRDLMTRYPEVASAIKCSAKKNLDVLNVFVSAQKVRNLELLCNNYFKVCYLPDLPSFQCPNGKTYCPSGWSHQENILHCGWKLWQSYGKGKLESDFIRLTLLGWTLGTSTFSFWFSSERQGLWWHMHFDSG